MAEERVPTERPSGTDAGSDSVVHLSNAIDEVELEWRQNTPETPALAAAHAKLNELEYEFVIDILRMAQTLKRDVRVRNGWAWFIIWHIRKEHKKCHDLIVDYLEIWLAIYGRQHAKLLQKAKQKPLKALDEGPSISTVVSRYNKRFLKNLSRDKRNRYEKGGLLVFLATPPGTLAPPPNLFSASSFKTMALAGVATVVVVVGVLLVRETIVSRRALLSGIPDAGSSAALQEPKARPPAPRLGHADCYSKTDGYAVKECLEAEGDRLRRTDYPGAVREYVAATSYRYATAAPSRRLEDRKGKPVPPAQLALWQDVGISYKLASLHSAQGHHDEALAALDQVLKLKMKLKLEAALWPPGNDGQVDCFLLLALTRRSTQQEVNPTALHSRCQGMAWTDKESIHWPRGECAMAALHEQVGKRQTADELYKNCLDWILRVPKDKREEVDKEWRAGPWGHLGTAEEAIKLVEGRISRAGAGPR